MPAISEPVFVRDGDTFVPTGHARGPWDPDAQHGGAPTALLAELVQAPGMVVTRMTFDLLGPVPLVPLTATTTVVKPGKRFQVLEAELRAEGRAVVQARVVRLRRAALAVTATPSAAPPPVPSAPTPIAHGIFDRSAEGFHRTAMDIRLVQGSFVEPGPAQAWFRLARPLIDAAPPSPLARIAAAADFGSGIGSVLDWETHLFINPDVSIHVHREPVGEWVFLDSTSWPEPTGVGICITRIFDARGPVGLAGQSLYLDRRA